MIDWEEAKQTLRLLAPVVIVLVMLAGMILVAGYPDYLHERGSQNACEEAFGENATYQGEVGGFLSSGDGVFCDTGGGEVRTTEGRTAPVTLGTFTDYLGAVGRGDA